MRKKYHTVKISKEVLEDSKILQQEIYELTKQKPTIQEIIDRAYILLVEVYDYGSGKRQSNRANELKKKVKIDKRII